MVCLLPTCGKPIAFQTIKACPCCCGKPPSNGVAENKIRQLQSQARTMLIHAAKRYAIRMANESSNEMPSLKFTDGMTPLQAFAGSRATTNPRFCQPLACPIYVLDPALQSAGGILGKWKNRAQLDLWLSFSPVPCTFRPFHFRQSREQPFKACP